MEQGTGRDEVMALMERITRLETALGYEARAWRSDLLQFRQEMRHRGFGQPLGIAGWGKLVAAVLLPFLVLLATGSPEKAQRAAQTMSLIP